MRTEREESLIECLFRGYRTLGFDADNNSTGADMLSHTGVGGNNLDAFIALMDGAFAEARADQEEADKHCCCGTCGL